MSTKVTGLWSRISISIRILSMKFWINCKWIRRTLAMNSVYGWLDTHHHNILQWRCSFVSITRHVQWIDGYKHMHNSRNYIQHFVSQVSKLFVSRLFVFVTAFWKFSVWILFTISPVRGLHRPKRVSNQLIHPNWRKRTSSFAVNLGGEFLSLYSVFTLCFWRGTATRTLAFPA